MERSATCQEGIKPDLLERALLEEGLGPAVVGGVAGGAAGGFSGGTDGVGS